MPDLDVYQQRLNQLLEAISDSDRITSETRSLVLTVLSSMLSIQQTSPEILAGSEHRASFWRAADATLEALPEALRRGDAAVLDWATDLLRSLNTVLGQIIDYRDLSERQQVRTRDELALAEDSLQRIAMLRTSLRLAESTRILGELEDVVDAARTATGTIGGDNLSQFFGEYASSEKRSAEVFRWSTIILIVGGATASLLLPHSAAGDWVGLVYRLVFVGAVAGLAAYFGRQASQHRRIANWAKALQVQLLAFPAFIAPIQDDEPRHAIYSAFASRVLGAPPERPSGKGDPDLDTAQMIELVTAFVKKS